MLSKSPRGYPCRHSLRLNARGVAAQARLRICSKCKTSLYKEEGCNKVTCRCGTLMCYVCKGKIAGYNHFCNHPKNPGEPCRKCNLCSLWSSPEVRLCVHGTHFFTERNEPVLVTRRKPDARVCPCACAGGRRGGRQRGQGGGDEGHSREGSRCAPGGRAVSRRPLTGKRLLKGEPHWSRLTKRFSLGPITLLQLLGLRYHRHSPPSAWHFYTLHTPEGVCVCLTRTAANRRGTTCVQLGQRPIGPEEEAAAAGRGRPKAVAPRGGAGPAVMAALAGMMPPPFAAGLANLMPMMPAYPFGGHRHHPNAEEMRALVSSVPHS